MSITPEEAWEEEAYGRMVDEIIKSNRDGIIDEFVKERMASYYHAHPDLADGAKRMVEEAARLIETSPAASLVSSTSATEITLRDVLLKPVAFGMIHDESMGSLMTELVIGNRHFSKLLLSILEDYGLNLNTAKLEGSSKSLWAEMKDTQNIRNGIVHRGEEASSEQAELSLKIAQFLLHRLYPRVKKLMTE